jgi:hypothetical protein
VENLKNTLYHLLPFFKPLPPKQSPNTQLSNKPTLSPNHWANPLKFSKNIFNQQNFFLHFSGWYRECSITPHTSDIDHSLRIHEFTPALHEAIKRAYLIYIRFGFHEDSLEFSMYTRTKPEIKMDLFFMYRLNATTNYVTTTDTVGKQVYLNLYPRVDRICTGDLLGVLVNVPCNVEEMLEVRVDLLGCSKINEVFS